MRWAAVVLPVTLAVLVGSVKAAVKCYGELGCLELDEPFYHFWNRPVSYTPDDRHEVNTRFILFTRRNDPKFCTRLRWDSDVDEVRAVPFNASRETKFLVHGYLDRASFGAWMNDMKNAYLKHADVNVIEVDWSDGNMGLYEAAVSNARIVGAEIALLVRKLQEAFGVDPKSMHIIGHSLGAHVAGYAGANITSLGRITALDPAEPHFEGMPPEVRLDQTDAEFVDVIHTDSHPYLSKLWSSEGMGMYSAVGHVDFYPNGGEYMPGCDMTSRILKVFTHGIVKGAREIVSCNHQRAVEYMLESITDEDCLPLAYECASFEDYKRGQCSDCGLDGARCAAMGERAVQWSRFKGRESRRMFTVTGAHSKFCLHQYAVTLTTGAKVGPVNGRGSIHLTDRSQGAQPIEINDWPVTFHPVQNYTFLVTTQTPISESSELLVEYKSTQILFVYNVPLLQVSVRPMTSALTERIFQGLTCVFDIAKNSKYPGSTYPGSTAFTFAMNEAKEKTFHRCSPWDPKGIAPYVTVALKNC